MKQGNLLKRNLLIAQENLFWIFCLFLFFVVLFFVVSSFQKEDAGVAEVQEISMEMIIGNYTGIVLDADALHFGTIKKGSGESRTRQTIITNNDNQTKQVEIRIRGNITEWTSLSESLFILGPYENKTIEVTVHPDTALTEGNYRGVLQTIIRMIP